MIGLDTNIVVRYVMQDDARQAPRASRLVESMTAQEPGFVSVVTVVELVWVLESSYELSREQVGAVLEGLLASRELVIDRSEVVGQALRAYRSGKADFADALIERIGHQAGCERTMTFDALGARDAGMVLLT